MTLLSHKDVSFSELHLPLAVCFYSCGLYLETKKESSILI